MTHLKEYRQATEITSFFMFCVFLFVPILAPYMKSLGMSDFHVSLIFALFPLTLIFASTTFGSLSDAIGRKKIIMFGIALELAGIALYITGLWYLILVARFFEALAFASVLHVGLAKVQDSLDNKTRGKYSGIALTIMQLGKIIAPVIGGLLADYWFIKAPFIFAMFALMIMLWLVSIHENFKINHHFSRSDFNFIEKMRRFFANRQLKGMGILGIVMHASTPVLLVFTPIYIVEHFGLPYRYVGYALFAMEFFMLFQFFVGSLADRFNRAKFTLFGVFLYGIMLLLLALAPGYWTFLFVLLFVGVGAAFWNVGAWSFMADIGAGIKQEGFVIGTYISVAKIGALISFICGGLIVQYLGIKYLMVVVGIFILIGGVVASFFMLSGPEDSKSKKK
jgi:MFS family permease